MASRRRNSAEQAADDKMNRFAEMLANGVDVQTAGARLGYSRGGSQVMMRRLRAKMGWQAV